MRLKYNDRNYEHFLENKSDFNKYFSDFIGRDWLLMGNSKECATIEEFKYFYNKHKKIIVKPLTLQQGQGIYIIENIEDIDKLYTELSSTKCLVEEIIKQNNLMVFGNSSVNTIRVYTIVDNHGKAHILKCILRAGVGNSVVDNYAAGGCIYQIDNQLGIVKTNGITKYKEDNIIHPGTNIVMLGYKIPNWDKVKETCKNAAEKIPQVRYIGWDVAITETSCLLIEGNHDPDYELLEFIGDRCYKPIIKSFLN